MNKRVYRPREGRVLVGVCSGIANYFNIDPVIIRLLMVIFCLAGGSGVIAYIIAAIIIPGDDTV